MKNVITTQKVVKDLGIKTRGLTNEYKPAKPIDVSSVDKMMCFG